MGTAAGYARMASWIARYASARAFVLDYPLAPEHPFPAATNNVVLAVRWLMAQGHERVAIAGDSAGGALALATVATLLEQGVAKPQVPAMVVFSPWMDLSFSGATVHDFDPVLPLEQLLSDAVKYLDGVPANHPQASPLYGIVGGMPPLLIQTAREELLLDDSVRYAERSAALGNEVHFEIWEGVHHDFQMCVEELKTAHDALQRTAAFLRR